MAKDGHLPARSVDSLAGEAAESDPACSMALDQDPEAVYFLLKRTWVEWDTSVREVLVTQASGLRHPLITSWLLLPNQGRSTLGKVLGEMKISTAKKQVLWSIAGEFPCNHAALHKWDVVPSAACTLCGHPAET